MESASISHVGIAGMRGGPGPFLRLQSDEKLVALTRRGNQAAYEVLVSRYDARLIAFSRHMLGSREDAEDVVQETFAAAYNAMVSDERPINVKPWLYRIARNRSLNHLRRQSAIGVDDFDHHVADHGRTAAEEVHQREEFRQLMSDVGALPETQRTALLLREIDALSYEQIAEAMDTTVPSVKSLLVRARVSLAEAAEGRRLTCEEVREELGEVAEGLRRMSPPVRRHLRECDRCSSFRASLKETNKALALMLPIGPILLLKKLFLAQLGTTASAGSGAAATTGAASAAAGAAATTGASGAISAGVTAIATKAAATVAAAAIVTAGAVEVNHATTTRVQRAPIAVVAQAPPRTAVPAPSIAAAAEPAPAVDAPADPTAAPAAAPVTAATGPTGPSAVPAPAPAPAPAGGTQEQLDDTTLPPATTDAPPATLTPPADPAAPPTATTPPATITPPADPAPPADPVQPAPGQQAPSAPGPVAPDVVAPVTAS